MQYNPLPLEDSGIDYYWISETAIIQNGVKHRDIQDQDARYDTVRLGYWIQVPSPTATILALRGCKFKQKMGQQNW